MTDLIDRQAVIDELEERIKANGYSNVALVSELNRCIGYIMRLPSSQPDRKKGEWIKVDPHIMICPFCKKASSPKNFCADCGADMRGEQDG